MTPRMLTPDFGVSGQIALNDVAAIAALGFTTLICNRPDSELQDEPRAADVEAQAKAQNLRFRYLPIQPGEEPVSQAAALAEALAQPEAKVFAYCRSGARSSTAFALSQTA